ncbi:hypothetical protein Glove_493g54 [Diversispora epigaea]|uniref:BZIP domain-containing protein n=1 Tax=Diversispora epigaea TaxID=1348612 RepID=A0A397GJM1_9GLOM|nr:hypothetical protein Glove_493g54 [Diversispora epigaea]
MSFMSTISFEDFNEVSMYDMVNDTYDVGESSETGSKRNQEEDRGEEVGEEVGEWTRFLNKDFNEVSMYDMVNDTYDIGESSEMGSKRNREEDRGEDKGEEVGEWTRFLNNRDFDEVTMYDMVNDIYDINKGESSEMGSRKRNREEDGGEDKGEEVGEGSRKRIHLDGGEGGEEDFDINDEEGEGEEENEVEIKLSKKRMSDRISAAKYRKKKRDEVENLVQVENELEEKNKSLRDEIDGLWVELFELKEFMFVHDINCPLGPF